VSLIFPRIRGSQFCRGPAASFTTRGSSEVGRDNSPPGAFARWARARQTLTMRAIWKGSISFGLVNIPIGLYPATRSERIAFRQLREDDLSPIRYKRVAEADGEE